jgi:hypothetical protein
MELSTKEKEQLKMVSKPELIQVSHVIGDIPPLPMGKQ